MSLISIEQFDEFTDAYPEMAQCYDLRYDSDLDDMDDPFFEALDWMDA